MGCFWIIDGTVCMKKGIHPKIRSEECIAKFKMQLKSFGFSYDWDREINTSDENFFKWTQWIFLKIFNSYYDEKENKAKPISELEIPEGLNEKKNLILLILKTCISSRCTG